MPIYELYCPYCHTLYSFHAPRPSRTDDAACPGCGRHDLERKPSRFATLKHRGDDDAPSEDPFAGVDEARLERAFSFLATQAEQLGEQQDQRDMGRLMRRFCQHTGLAFGERMEEMMRRLEAGEDPDRLEAEMAIDEESDSDGLGAYLKAKKALRQRPPRVDEELYFL